jgi:hypothetical protein
VYLRGATAPQRFTQLKEKETKELLLSTALLSEAEGEGIALA